MKKWMKSDKIWNLNDSESWLHAKSNKKEKGYKVFFSVEKEIIWVIMQMWIHKEPAWMFSSQSHGLFLN